MVARLEICDIINEVEIGAKDSIKYLKKKLTTKAHPAVLVKTLLVLETCTKNCGRRFHLQLADRSFMDQLAKLVVGKNALGGLVRIRALVAVSAVPRATYNRVTPMQIEPPLSVESGTANLSPANVCCTRHFRLRCTTLAKTLACFCS